jgi:hypothetical protein
MLWDRDFGKSELNDIDDQLSVDSVLLQELVGVICAINDDKEQDEWQCHKG